MGALEQFLKRPMTRRAFTKVAVTAAVVGSQTALWVPRNLEDLLEEDHRVWALGEVKAAAADLMDWGYLVHGYGMTLVTQDISGMGKPGVGVTGRRLSYMPSLLHGAVWDKTKPITAEMLGDQATAWGAVYVETINPQNMPPDPTILLAKR